jgi:hypothetical protein
MSDKGPSAFSNWARRLAHPSGLAGVAVLVALFIALGCGNGDDDDPPPPSNKWDEMKWDEGKWGAIPTLFDAIPIA